MAGAPRVTWRRPPTEAELLAVFNEARTRHSVAGDTAPHAWAARWSDAEPQAVAWFRRKWREREWSNALHEAAHAVADVLAGRRIIEATLESTLPGVVAHVRSEVRPSTLRRVRADEDTALDALMDHVVAAYAGLAAEEAFAWRAKTRADREGGAQGDERAAESLLRDCVPEDRLRAQLRGLGRSKANLLVIDHEQEIRRVASALRRRRRLTEAEVHRAMRWTAQLPLPFEVKA